MCHSPKKKPRTGRTFQQFSVAKDTRDGAYAKEYIRTSLISVKKINKLRECSKVLPKAADKPIPMSPPTMTKATPMVKPT